MSMSEGTATGAARIVALGLDGGPRLNVMPSPVASAQPALALVVEDAVYLVDCGYDTARQMLRAGLRFDQVRDVFITHHHFDHTSGLPGLILHGWTTIGALSAIGCWGPPAVVRQIDGIRNSFAAEIGLFEAGGGFGPFPTVRPHAVHLPPDGVHRVMQDELVVVDATRVFHGPEVEDAYAYRFTIKGTGKVVVFSGDTAAPNPALIELARGCDVLVHEVQDNRNVERLAASFPDARRADALRTHLFESHSDVADVPAVAKAAGAKRLVLCHYTPIPQPPEVYAVEAQAAADAIGYRGAVLAPTELDSILI